MPYLRTEARGRRQRRLRHVFQRLLRAQLVPPHPAGVGRAAGHAVRPRRAARAPHPAPWRAHAVARGRAGARHACPRSSSARHEFSPGRAARLHAVGRWRRRGSDVRRVGDPRGAARGRNGGGDLHVQPGAAARRRAGRHGAGRRPGRGAAFGHRGEPGRARPAARGGVRRRAAGAGRPAALRRAGQFRRRRRVRARPARSRRRWRGHPCGDAGRRHRAGAGKPAAHDPRVRLRASRHLRRRPHAGRRAADPAVRGRSHDLRTQLGAGAATGGPGPAAGGRVECAAGRAGGPLQRLVDVRAAGGGVARSRAAAALLHPWRRRGDGVAAQRARPLHGPVRRNRGVARAVLPEDRRLAFVL